MFEPSVRVQTYVVCAVLIACFSIIYPKIFHPLILKYFGFSDAPTNAEREHQLLRERMTMHGPNRPHPTLRSNEQPQSVKRGGVLTVVLPVYVLGIAVYLIYTLSKVFSSKRKSGVEKDKFLRHYYRDFHYDANQGKFRMGHGSSSEEDEPEYNSVQRMGFDGFREYKEPPYTTKDGNFDWSAAYGSLGQPDIYRSSKSFPRDLESLLMRLENEDINQDELSALRARLEKTESEMTKLLEVMDKAEQAVLNMADSCQEESESEADLKHEGFDESVDPMGLD